MVTSPRYAEVHVLLCFCANDSDIEIFGGPSCVFRPTCYDVKDSFSKIMSFHILTYFLNIVRWYL